MNTIYCVETARDCDMEVLKSYSVHKQWRQSSAVDGSDLVDWVLFEN